MGRAWSMPTLTPLPRELDHQPIHVCLILARGTVANPYGTRPTPPLEMIQLDFRQAALAVDGVQHLHVIWISGRGALNEMANAVRLRLGARAGESPHRENGIAD